MVYVDIVCKESVYENERISWKDGNDVSEGNQASKVVLDVAAAEEEVE